MEPEKKERRRGRPPKNKQPDIETPATIVRRDYQRMVDEGSNLVAALEVAQNSLFTQVDMPVALSALIELASRGLTLAIQRNNDAITQEVLNEKREAYTSALRRLVPNQAPQPAPTAPSNLPPMTGRKS